jgi:hypothetical protein
MKPSTIKINILKATSRIEEVNESISDYFDAITEGDTTLTESEARSLKMVVENFREKIDELDGIAEEADDALEGYIKEVGITEKPLNTIVGWIMAMGYDTKSNNVREDVKKLLKVMSEQSNDETIS